jgi:nitroreductase
MKRVFCVLVIVVAAQGFLAAQQSGNAGLDVILRNFAASQWAAGNIPDADVQQIVNAGVRTPSAMNRQPWKFTVVRTKSLADRIVSRMPDGSILIVISTDTDIAKNPNVLIDCGLATENIYLAAQALGYGSRIYTGPIRDMVKDTKLRADLGLGTKWTPTAVVRIGKLAPGVDAVSSASRRKSAGDVVEYK